MTSEVTFTLGSFVTLVRGTTYKGALVGKPGPVLLGLASIQPDGGFRESAFKTYGGESPPKITLGPGNIYVSLKDVTQSGDLLGSVARVPPTIPAGRLTQDTVKLEFNGRPIDTSYVYWLLRTPAYRAYCRARATGTTTLGLARDDFLSFPVLEPGERQLSLVQLLEGLDNRIGLLRETNATLEAIAQALFKSWFVDFDPVRAKQQGLAPAGMDEATTALLPHAFEESGIGLIPKGWKVRPLDQTADFLNGLALQKFPPSKDSWLPVVKIAQLRKGNTDGADRTSGSIKPEYVVQNGDVLFSWSGSLEVKVWCGGTGALNQHLFKVTSATFPKWFYLQWTRHHLEHFREIAASKATTMGHIQRIHLSQAHTLAPSLSELAAMDAVFAPLLQRTIENELQAQTLATLRDTLLPRLISGLLRLPEAESPTG